MLEKPRCNKKAEIILDPDCVNFERCHKFLIFSLKKHANWLATEKILIIFGFVIVSDLFVYL